MDALKIQTNILKGLYKGKIKLLYKYTINEDIYISTDGFSVYRIPSNKFFIDTSQYNETDILKDVIIQANEGTKATKVTRFDKPDKNAKNGIGNALALYNKDGNAVYVNYDLVKQFEEKNSFLEFTINNKVEPVGIWDRGEFVGVVLPFRYNKNGVDPMKNEREYYE